MSCSGGVCAPTKTHANLNVTDLDGLLASGNVKIATTGSGVEANDIRAKAKLSWQSANMLTLDAYQSIRIERYIAVLGPGGMSVVTNDGGTGGTFLFGPNGRVSFKNMSSLLTINGAAYTLVKSIASLAKALAANPSGDYALADDYDASKDGSYSGIPITTTVSGTVEGLGNIISNFSIINKQQNLAGLFHSVDYGGTVDNLGLENLKIRLGETPATQGVGGLALLNEGVLLNDHVTGSISVKAKQSGAVIGGLVGETNGGVIANSYSTVRIDTNGAAAGSLVGVMMGGTISESFATGAITNTYMVYSDILTGGLIGGANPQQSSLIENSYATGGVNGTTSYYGGATGGLLGGGGGVDVVTSYSTGPVSADGGAGGFAGYVASASDCYWDIKTSGQSNGTANGNISGLTGQTTKQFRSGLPQGFDPAIWAEDSNINNGFPYLINNPPK